jgi:hypothetical protein
MATVVADMSMSLDGFIADRNDDAGPLFDWFTTGTVEIPTADPRWTFKTYEASAKQLHDALATAGALICGRRLFDFTHVWGGRHPMGCPNKQHERHGVRQTGANRIVLRSHWRQSGGMHAVRGASSLFPRHLWPPRSS